MCPRASTAFKTWEFGPGRGTPGLLLQGTRKGRRVSPAFWPGQRIVTSPIFTMELPGTRIAKGSREGRPFFLTVGRVPER